MTYLLSQIFVSLLLAAVAGGALGWILHGMKAHRRERELSGLINRHASALSQAQQERQMIADDYDEMKLGLESRIGELQLENRKLPELEDNLEKSQQLVQQMMKSHKSELSDTQSQSEQLRLELDNLRVQQKNDHSEISALRKTNAELGGNNNLATTGSPSGNNQTANNRSEADSSKTIGTAEPQKRSAAEDAQLTGKAAYQRAHGRAHHSGSHQPSQDHEVTSAITTGSNPIDESALSAAATQAELMELESEIEEMRGYNRDHNVPPLDLGGMQDKVQVNATPATDHKAGTAAAKAATVAAASTATAAGMAMDRSAASQLPEASVAEESVAEESVAENRNPEKSSEIAADLVSEHTTDNPTQTAADLRNRFQSASRNGDADDLQTIHGIGPVIEKSLNDLGIINYRQIAELTRREVEEIAEILEIFPGRIERDNWIGTARKLAGDSKNQTIDNKNTEVKDTEVRKEVVSPALQAKEV